MDDLRRAKSGEKNLQGTDLRGAALSQLDLIEKPFSGRTMCKVTCDLPRGLNSHR